MALLDLVALPVKLAVAATNTTPALGTLVSPDGPVRRPDGTADRLMVMIGEDGALDRLLDEDGFVDKLVSDGGALDQLVALGTTLERIQPRIAELMALIPDLHA
ncbi:hypothetical protein BH10ACT10_BH10ACT10_11470 [soil metagenome]